MGNIGTVQKQIYFTNFDTFLVNAWQTQLLSFGRYGHMDEHS